MKLPALFPQKQLTRILGHGQGAFATYAGLPRLPKRSATSPVLEDAFDAAMMERCIRLSEEAVRQGEYPFAAIICRDGEVLVEATNRVRRDQDVSRHAEIVALSEAQKLLGSSNFDGCMLGGFKWSSQHGL